MNPESINRAIAEWCGWTSVDLLTQVGRIPESRDDGNRYQNIPNYHSDLNAVHEAEMRLSPTQFQRYLTELTMLMWLGRCATVPEQCEALLRALGLWNK